MLCYIFFFFLVRQRGAEVLQSHVWGFGDVSVYCWEWMGEHLCQRRASCRLWAFNCIFTLSSWAYIEKKNQKCLKKVHNYCWKLSVSNGLFTACAPTFIYNPVKKVLLGAENGRVVIECTPRAAPKPKFIWKRGSELLNNSSRLVSRS